MTIAFQNGSFLNGTASASTNLAKGGVSISSFYNTDYLENKYNYAESKESYEIAAAGRDAAIATDISKFKTYLGSGEEDKAMDAYQELIDEMSAQERYSQLVSESGNDEQLRAVAKTLIEEQLDGVALEDYITKHARKNSSVENQKLLWGAKKCDSTSREDLLNETCDLDIEETHSNCIKKAFFGIAGLLTKACDGLFGNGTKH